MKRRANDRNGNFTARHKRRCIQKQVENSLQPILRIIDESKKKEESKNGASANQAQTYEANCAIELFSKPICTESKKCLSNESVEIDNEPHIVQPENNSATDDINLQNGTFENTPWNQVKDEVIFDDLEDEYRYSECSDEEDDESNLGYGYATTDKQDQHVKTDVDIQETISQKLKCMLPSWKSDNYITQSALTDLLHRIRKEVPEIKLPLDARTLQPAEEHGEIHSIGGGDYCHFGLQPCLEKIVIERRLNKDESVDIDLLINIDGAPMGQSSTKNLWPILCSERKSRKVRIIGVYHGSSKPEDANEYLKFFVDEMTNFVINGILVYNVKYNVSLDGLICDAPAKAYVLGIKNHTGYLCCSKCDIYGVWMKTVCFPGEIGTLRSDEKFHSFAYYNGDKGYQLRRTILTRIPRFGLVSRVPLDPMHLIFVGIVRKLLLILMFGRIRWKLSWFTVVNISNILMKLSDYITYEFARRPRHLMYIKNFKATELRQFCLYTGVIALKKFVNRDVYDHFVTLHVATSILSNSLMVKDESWFDYAEKLNENFVKNFETLYGKRYVSYNVHNLHHIANDVRRYGDLENFSAFRFENCIGHIKRLLRSGRRPLQQLMRRSAELEDRQKKSFFIKKTLDLLHIHSDGPMPDNFLGANQYKVGVFDCFKINCLDNKNNYVLVENIHPIRIYNLIRNDKNEVYIVGRALKIIDPLYTYPCSSSVLGINVVKEDLKSNLQYWSVASVTAKLLRLPYANNFVVFPMLHTIRQNSC